MEIWHEMAEGEEREAPHRAASGLPTLDLPNPLSEVTVSRCLSRDSMGIDGALTLTDDQEKDLTIREPMDQDTRKVNNQ